MSSIQNISGQKFRLEPNETIRIPIRFEFVYCKYASREFSLKFSEGSEVPFNTRKKIRLNEETQLIYLINTSNQVLDIELVIGYGDYMDDSTTIDDIIDVQSTPMAYTLTPENLPKEYKIGENGYVELNPINNSLIRIQNISENNLRLFSKNGFILLPYGVEEISLKSNFRIYGEVDSEFVFGGFN